MHLSELIERRRAGLFYSLNQFKDLDCWTKGLCLSDKLTDTTYGSVGQPVNCVRWNSDGSMLLSAGDALRISIWSGYDHKLLGSLGTPHTNNIFDAQFVPGSNNTEIVSCAVDGKVFLHDVRDFIDSQESSCDRLWSFHGMAIKIRFLPNTSHTFLVSSRRGEIKLIDTRDRSVETIYKETGGNCYSLSFDPITPDIFAVSTSSPVISTYDLRKTPKPFNSLSGQLQQFCHPGKFIF